MELYQVLPKIGIFILFCQIYGVMLSFAKIIFFNFFCQNYGNMLSFVKNMEFIEVLPKI
jgi:hypothetical protein